MAEKKLDRGEERRQSLAAWRAKGGQVAAVLPVHNPRALLRACGYLPVELWGPPGQAITRGDSHLQAYTCSLVRHALAFIADGRLSEHVRHLVVPHACDSLQGLGSLLLDFQRPELPVTPYYLPRGGRDSDARFLAAELRSLGAALVGSESELPAEEALHAACAREERADARLAELLDRRLHLALSNRRFYELVRSREYLPAEDFDAKAEAELARAEAKAEAPALPLLLSGILPEPMGILDALDAAGATVVADDLACAGRRCYRAFAQEKDPYLRLARGLLSGAPDSTRGASVEARAEHLIARARKSGARGVVFFLVKFCEPELFYLPQLGKRLEDAGLRALTVEVHIGETLPDQVVTRLEAFLETLT